MNAGSLHKNNPVVTELYSWSANQCLADLLFGVSPVGLPLNRYGS